jgi:hypothetical protein
MIADQPIAMAGRGAAFEGASADGRVVYFRTNAPLTPDDPNGGSGTEASDDSWDLYRYELPASLSADPGAGTLTRISGGPTGTADPNTNCTVDQGTACAGGEGGRGAAARYVSDDGQRVYFTTNAPIPGAANDSPDNVPDGPVDSATTSSGFRNLYLYDAAQSGSDRWKFVTRIPVPADAEASGGNALFDSCASYGVGPVVGRDFAVTTKVHVPSGGSCVRGSSDGAWLVFQTAGALTVDDEDDAVDVYVYDAAGDALHRVSAPPAGQEPYPCSTLESCNADLGFEDVQQVASVTGLDSVRHWNVSDDGEVFFETRLSLVGEDANGSHYDTYMWRAGELSLISPGDSAHHAFYSGNSEDGDDVFFWTSQRIDPREIDDADFDIYDARVGGGFPPPPPPPGPGCSALADGCQGPGAGPVPVGVGTTQPGGGNAEPGTRAHVVVRAPGRRLRRRAARVGVVPLRVRTATPGRVVAVARGRMRRRAGGRRMRIVARERARMRSAGATTLRLRLSRPAKRHLRSGRPLRLRIVVRQPGARRRTLALVLRRAGR